MNFGGLKPGSYLSNFEVKQYSTIKSLSLVNNFSWTLLGNVINAACKWGMLVVMAKLGFAGMLGMYTLGLAISAPVFMFGNLQLRSIQATDAHDQYSFGHYLGLRINTTVMALILLVIIAMLAFRGEKSTVIILLGLTKGLESISDVVYGFLQKNECMRRIGLSLIFKGILSLFVFGLVLRISGSLIAGILGFTVVWLLLLLAFDLAYANKYVCTRPVFKSCLLWSLARLSIPLGVVMMLISLNTNIPRYFIEHYLGLDSLGYFGAMAFFVVAGNTVAVSLGQSAEPRLAKYYAEYNRKAFCKLLSRLVMAGALLGFLGLTTVSLLGGEILTLVYAPGYAKYSNVFILIMVNSVIVYISSILGSGMTAARFFKMQPLVFAVACLANIVSCLILIPAKGFTGAAYALIISSTVQLLGSLLINLQALYQLRLSKAPSEVANATKQSCTDSSYSGCNESQRGRNIDHECSAKH